MIRTWPAVPSKVLSTTLCVACLVISGACSGARESPPTFTLSLVGTNDLHGGIVEVSGRGGLALLDGYVTNLRAARQQDDGGVLLVDAGDLFQGTLESNLNEGAVVISAYNALGYQAATIGNHEFDYGPVGGAAVARAPGDDPLGALKARLVQARFPFVAANLIDASTQAPVQFPNAVPSTIVDVRGVRVGIVGLLTEPGLTLTAAANVKGLGVAPIAKALVDQATRLREQGASVVIALAHSGGKCDRVDSPQDLSSCEPKAEIFEVARQVPAGLVDAIVAGHRHDALAHEVNGVPIIQSYAGGRAFGRIDLIVNRASGRVQAHRIFPPRELCAREVPGSPGCAPASALDAKPAEYEGKPVVASAAIAAIIQPAIDEAVEAKARPLNTMITAHLTHSDREASTVGDLEADWMRALVPGADAAITNTGGLRSDIDEGPFTYGRLHQLLPFDNQRLTISMTVAQLGAVIQENLGRTGSMVTLSGVLASAACEHGQLTVTLRRDSGRALRADETLTIVTTDFLATGGDGFFAPVMPVRIEGGGDLLRDEIAEMLLRTGGHWGAERRTLPARITYPGNRPVSCAPEP